MPAWQLAAIVAALVAAAFVLAGAIALWRDPYVLVRAEFARERIALGLARRVVVVDGIRWVYAEARARDPDAPTLVMLHGYTGGKENWYRVARRLRGRYRLLLPDLPGWGESQREGVAGHAFSAQAARVAAFIRATCGEGPVVVLGHSMGGGIAALVAARWPERVARVGLFNAAGVRFADNAFGLGVLAGDNPFAVTDAASLRRFIDTVFFDEAAKPWVPWPASAALIAKRRADAAFEQAVLERIGRSEDALLPGEEAARIRQPALLLWGRQDAVIDASALDLYAARIPQARKVLLEGCGHMSIAEQPRAAAEAVVALVQNGDGIFSMGTRR